MDSLSAMVLKRFAAPEYATFFEVSSTTGFGPVRRADAVAFGVWPSRGLHVSGFEFKVSRADWLRELRDPSKSDAVGKYCDFWWAVAPDTKVIPVEEVPPTWGLFTVRRDALHIVKQAPKRERAPLSAGFVAACLRKVPETHVPKVVVEREVAERAEALAKSTTLGLQRELERLRATHKHLVDQVEAFEKASGVKVGDQWSFASTAETTGRAVAALSRMLQGRENPLAPMAHAATQFLADYQALTSVLKETENG